LTRVFNLTRAFGGGAFDEITMFMVGKIGGCISAMRCRCGRSCGWRFSRASWQRAVQRKLWLVRSDGDAAVCNVGQHYW